MGLFLSVKKILRNEERKRVQVQVNFNLLSENIRQGDTAQQHHKNEALHQQKIQYNVAEPTDSLSHNSCNDAQVGQIYLWYFPGLPPEFWHIFTFIRNAYLSPVTTKGTPLKNSTAWSLLWNGYSRPSLTMPLIPSNQTVKKAPSFVWSVLIRFGWISNLLLFPGMILSERRNLQQD